MRESMTIHVIQKGETIQSIAEQYGVSAERLMLENEIINPNRIAIGEAIVIQYPEISYTIQEGDTLLAIANEFKVSVLQLLRNNPYLSNREFIYPGETIVIQYKGNKNNTIAVNGYAFPFIDRNDLRKTLPFLTYLTIFSYSVTAEGEINTIDDTEIIQIAKDYGVSPIMMLSVSSNSMEEEINVIHSILSSTEKQERFINNTLNILQTKGYSGVSVNTPYLLPVDRRLYEEFSIRFAKRLSEEGYKVFDTISIRIFQILSGILFTDLDFSEISQEVDGITLLSFMFGYSEGIPPGTIAMDSIRRFIDYSTKIIPAEKLYFGMPTIGYVWTYPYIPNESKGMAIDYNAAIDNAIDRNIEIQFDTITNTAYYQYISGDEFIVRFWDARSIDGFVKLVPDLGLKGISIWNLMSWFPQMWMVINSQYNIEKIQ